jgi:hypothetical protein
MHHLPFLSALLGTANGTQSDPCLSQFDPNPRECEASHTPVGLPTLIISGVILSGCLLMYCGLLCRRRAAQPMKEPLLAPDMP